MNVPFPPKSWDWPDKPMLLPVMGLRDQTTQMTYLPWSDVTKRLLGFQMVPHTGKAFLVYFIPLIDQGKYEIRCHAATEEPDPAHDEVLAIIEIPDKYFED